MATVEETVDARGIPFHCVEAGEGQALFFIHGMCGFAEVWRGQAERLSPRFRCVAYDRRGHTGTPRGTEPESTETHAMDGAALIEALDLDRPVVVGSSGGARIALELARTRPDLLAGAVFSEPPAFAIDPEAAAGLLKALKGVVGPAVAAGDARAAVDAFFPLLCPGLWSSLDEEGRDRYRANGPMMLEELTGPPYPLTAAGAATIAVPALVLSGTESHPALQALARRLADVLPEARWVALAGSGHVTYAERPDAFARAVAGFAGNLAVAGPQTGK
ncbi:MAG TPA: alpha/beta hydrolase [Actinomycetota bacterium]|nr:alpha/beta hydrolase [Actinomycetota bacterium]